MPPSPRGRSTTTTSASPNAAMMIHEDPSERRRKQRPPLPDDASDRCDIGMNEELRWQVSSSLTPHRRRSTLCRRRSFFLLSLALLAITPALTRSTTTTTTMPTTNLRNSDFLYGTYIIKSPGMYKLAEDITFRPNTVRHVPTFSLIPAEVVACCKPTASQLSENGGPYESKPYGLGFFAAIAIEASDVVLDLDGHTLEQSDEHALMQRFYAHIELANSPFIPGQGPADFGQSFRSASRVTIRNGTLGRSSHHGVHGNGNVGVTMEKLTFVDFEVAAVALNGVDGLVVRDCHAKGSRRDVPVIGMFSAALFIRPFLAKLEESGTDLSLTIGSKGAVKHVSAVRIELEQSIHRVFVDVVRTSSSSSGTTKGVIDRAKHPEEYALFHNRFGVIEANAFGFACNPMGVAVHGFPLPHDPNNKKSPKPSKNVLFEDVTVTDLAAAVMETVGLTVEGTGGAALTDAVGAILQVRNSHPDDNGRALTISTLDDDDEAVYVGNVVANAQLIVAKAQILGLIDAPRNTINVDVLGWVETGKPLSQLLALLAPRRVETGYVCNGDIMAHVNKGVIGFKIDGTENAILSRCSVDNLANLGSAGSTVCGMYDFSIKGSTSEGYGGANARGYSFAGTVDAQVRRCAARGVATYGGGMAVGFDVHMESKKVRMYRCGEKLVSSTGTWNALCPPDALGIRMEEGTAYNKAYDPCLEQTVAPNGLASTLVDEGTNNQVVMLKGGCPFMDGR